MASKWPFQNTPYGISGYPGSSLLLRTSKTRQAGEHSYPSTLRTKPNCSRRRVEAWRSKCMQWVFHFPLLSILFPLFRHQEREHRQAVGWVRALQQTERERDSRILSAHRQSLRLPTSASQAFAIKMQMSTV